MSETQGSRSVSTKLERIAELAKRRPTEALNTLAHHIDLEWLKEAHRLTRKDAAAGSDGVTAKAYANALEDNLRALLDRAKGESYRAPNVRRVYIPKGNGPEMRPLGIPTFEDKILQRAVAMVLTAVYEQEFLDCSYGFRPGRSQHDGLEALQNRIVRVGGGWILEVDIRKFFDTLDHGLLRETLRRRVRDGVIERLIGKWLNAGVLENGAVTYPEEGTPQGGVISPLLANVFLHEVLDTWFERDVKPRLEEGAWMFRFADDAVMVFASERDARRVLEVLPKRFEKYGLALHPDKTRLTEFRRPDRRPPGSEEQTFDWLGFTHHWGMSRNRKWIVKRRTAKDRFRRSLRAIAGWCRRHRHDPVPQQHVALSRKLRGHYNYYGIIGNFASLHRFWHHVKAVWHQWLRRRSNRPFSWMKMHALLRSSPLPTPKIIKPFTTSVANSVH
jgi:RNA-directed DNA polymerase